MKKALSLASVLLIGLAAVTCGSSQSLSPQQQAAKSLVTDVEGLNALAANPNSDAVYSLIDLMGDAAGLISTGATSGALSTEDGILGADLTCTTSAALAGGTKITYACNLTGGSITGTIIISSVSGGGNLFVIDLTMAGGGYTGMKYTGSLTITSTSIAGTISYNGQITVPPLTFTYTITTNYNSIVLDASGCPISGNTSTTMAVGGGIIANYTATAVYGPACGNIVVTVVKQ